MRVIAGRYGGRRIAAPKGMSTRPTADRVREAVFSRLLSIVGEVDGISVLDAYAGSGALGIEALSRGAARATFADSSRRACETVRKNLAALDARECSDVVCADVRATARQGLPGEPFALLFFDPPYRIRKSEVRGVVQALHDRGALAAGAVLVWEHDSTAEAEWPQAFEDLGTRTYGSTAVSMARLPDRREG